MKRLASLLGIAFSLAACGITQPSLGPVAQAGQSTDAAALGSRSTFKNPVIDSDFPDPCVIRASDGYYYAYATQGPNNGHLDNIACARSKDLVKWDRLADALPLKPSWAAHTQNFWAPHVIEQKGTYILYYAAQADNPAGQDGFHMAIGVATAKSPSGPFVATAAPLELEDGFAAIDPFVMTDPTTGKVFMFWGSGFQPIRVRELTGDGLAFAPGSQATVALTPRDRPFEHLIEGAWVRKRDGYFYLFYSGDRCCTDAPGVGEPTYAVMVARAKSITGPYERLMSPNGDAAPVLHRNDHWLAPGHNAVVTDGSGKDWIVYHAVDSSQRNTPGTNELRRCLLIDPLQYDGGWPHVANDSPSGTVIAAPRAR